MKQLLVIDPQNDFCDLPEAYRSPDPATGARPAPALPVAGAHADLQRLAAFIRRHAGTLDAITVTLDSHQRLDIAHPPFWRRGDGASVAPFTPITAAQLDDGTFVPRDPAALPRARAYLQALQARGRYTLMVWPVHCEIGTWGHNVHADVHAASLEWEARRGRSVQLVAKGLNPWTEHYSALQAEVPADDDAATQLNRPLLAALDAADVLYVAGEAGSHCVKATTEHLAEHLPSGRIDKLVLLTDCMSAVGGFEPQQRAFLEDLRSRGARLATSTDAR